ncbi:MAG: hypothetical protein HWE27_12865 [Gammaproteobacteria bacterium]|nr:hypothetical protein [Gammaproteobacteria bacterium]
MTNELVNHLNKILSSASLQSLSPIEKAIHGPSWSKSEEGKALIEYLESVDTYSEFNEHLQLLGNGGASINLLNLADWLVERASTVGPEQAEIDINDYMNSDHFEAYGVMLLANTHIDNEFEFYNGIKLVHAYSLNNKWLSQSVQMNSYGQSLPLLKTDCVLVCPFQHAKYHWSNTDLESKHSKIDIPYNSLEEVKACLILARPLGYGLQSIATSVVVADNIPIIQSISGWSLHSFKMPPLAPSVLNIEMNRANEILKRLHKLDEKNKTKILSQVERFNGYSSGASMVDRSIDLRICLESIFLDDGNKEQLRYTLSLRAALFLSESLEERKDIVSKMKKAYDVTSTAVHTGGMPNKNVELLPEVAELARKAILKIIEIGDINWQEVELQSK